MMSRSKTLPWLSSSRQMIMAWKVSGLSQSPAITASRPAAMRLAMAISPSRERSPIEAISRRYIRTGSSVRSAGSLAPDLAGAGPCLICTHSFSPFGYPLFLFPGGPLFPKPSLFGLDDVDAHLAELRQNVFNLLGIDFFGSQQRVNLVVGDITALLGGADQLLDGRAGKIEQRGLVTLLLQHLLLLRRYLPCHESPRGGPAGRPLP